MIRKSILAMGSSLLLAAILIAGCGGGSGGSTSEGAATTTGGSAAAGSGSAEAESHSTGEEKAPANGGEEEPSSGSKEAFVAKANALCEKRRKEIQKEAARVFSSAQKGNAKELKSALSRLIDEAVVPGLEAEVKDLGSLSAPKGDEGQVGAIVAGIEAMIAEARRESKAFLNTPAGGREANKLAREYGIPACGTIS